MTPRPDQLHTFASPYQLLRPLANPDRLGPEEGLRSTALVWSMGSEFDETLLRLLRWRTAGVPLVVIAPPAREIDDEGNLLRVLELCRPIAMLPFHQEPNALDLRVLLRQTPDPFAGMVVDYLTWRGLVLDLDVRQQIRRIIDLSGEIRTVSGLARGMYISRRALGRRLLTLGLPVPSHWLHFSRLLRAVIRVQQGEAGLATIAVRLGYPDGFSLSNQMKRLTGFRPTDAKKRLGWEWLVEAWLQTEMRSGGFSEDNVELLHSRGSVVCRHPQGDGGSTPPDRGVRGAVVAEG